MKRNKINYINKIKNLCVVNGERFFRFKKRVIPLTITYLIHTDDIKRMFYVMIIIITNH